MVRRPGQEYGGADRRPARGRDGADAKGAERRSPSSAIRPAGVGNFTAVLRREEEVAEFEGVTAATGQGEDGVLLCIDATQIPTVDERDTVGHRAKRDRAAGAKSIDSSLHPDVSKFDVRERPLRGVDPECSVDVHAARLPVGRSEGQPDLTGAGSRWLR